MKKKMKILVSKLTKENVKINWIKQISTQILLLEGVKQGEISIVLSDNAFIQDLNKQYRGIDSPTDVLAFSFIEKADEAPLLLQQGAKKELFESFPSCLGEIIISCQQAKTQAQEQKHSLVDEVKMLLVHGILHIIGYDHIEGYKSNEPIFIRTREILEKLEDA